MKNLYHEVFVDIAQTLAWQIIFIENAPLVVHVAEALRIRTILRSDHRPTRAKLASLRMPD